jgi:hypothetical protein
VFTPNKSSNNIQSDISISNAEKIEKPISNSIIEEANMTSYTGPAPIKLNISESADIDINVETPLYLEETEKITPETKITNRQNNDNQDLEEIEFDLDELPEENAIQLKQRDTVYYDMYKEAKRKAKMARDLAISSYLEAKNIKQTYMLDDIEDSDSDFDESDLDIF